MSLEAMVYVLNCQDAPDPLAKWVLMGIANHADRYGRNAFPAQFTLAEYAGCSDRSVRRKLDELEGLGLIVRGDQGLVQHLPANRRPVVWDLAGLSVRPDTAVRPSDSRPDTGVQTGRTLLSDKPSFEPNTPLPPVTGCPRHAAHSERCRTCRRGAAARAETEARRREAAERIERNRILQAEIDRCGMCNEYGYLGSTLCTHDPTTTVIAKTGAAKVREAMGWTR